MSEPTRTNDALWGDGGLFDQIAAVVAEGEQRGRAEVSAAVEAVADEIESERTNFDFIRREHAQVAAQLRAALADPAAAVARIKAEVLREAADELDDIGRQWRGAPMLAFYALADDLRTRADRITP